MRTYLSCVARPRACRRPPRLQGAIRSSGCDAVAFAGRQGADALYLCAQRPAVQHRWQLHSHRRGVKPLPCLALHALAHCIREIAGSLRAGAHHTWWCSSTCHRNARVASRSPSTRASGRSVPSRSSGASALARSAARARCVLCSCCGRRSAGKCPAATRPFVPAAALKAGLSRELCSSRMQEPEPHGLCEGTAPCVRPSPEFF